MVFCFRHVDWANQKFQIASCGADYMVAVVNKLKNLCTMDIPEMLRGGKSTRCHVIEFGDTTEPSGFTSLPTHLRELRGIQFMITKNDHGRVHGFAIDNVFHVVWFDPEHKLYP